MAYNVSSTEIKGDFNLPIQNNSIINPSKETRSNDSSVISDSRDNDVLEWLKSQGYSNPFDYLRDRGAIPSNDDLKGSNWNPDPDSSPEDNLASLEAYIARLFNFGTSSLTDSSLLNGENILDLLTNTFSSVKKLWEKYYADLAGSTSFWSVAEKIVDYSQKYFETLTTQALSYQSWYLQQDYNSPANQLKRLEQAGLSSAFVFSGLSSGNAQQSASVMQGQMAGSYGFGQVAQAEKAAQQSYDVGLMDAYAHNSEATTALLNANVNSIKTLAEADNIRKMTPIQVASSLQEFLNLGVTYDYLNREVLKIENDTFSDWFKNDFSSYQNELTAADNRVNQIQNTINNASTESFALAMDSRLIDTESYSGYVKTKEGQIVRKDYSLDALSKAYENHGYDEEGNEVFSEDDLRSSGSISGGLSIPQLGFNVGASGEVEAGEKNGNKSNSKHGSSRSDSSSKSRSSGHYDDKTRTLTIGNQSFTRTTSRKLMKSKEYSEYMNSLKNDLIKAKNDYFMLTTGERARAFQNYQLYLENKAKGISWFMGNNVRKFFLDLQKPEIQIGD